MTRIKDLHAEWSKDPEYRQEYDALACRVVVTKGGTIYELEPNQIGRPAAEVFGAANAERLGLTDATVYDMPDGRRVIARPEPSNSF